MSDTTGSALPRTDPSEQVIRYRSPCRTRDLPTADRSCEVPPQNLTPTHGDTHHRNDCDGRHPDCPAERFPTLPAAQAALLGRRARAALSGSPHTQHRTAYPCSACGGAHLIRATTPDEAAA